jgi:CRP-like cAMP-binding protein
MFCARYDRSHKTTNALTIKFEPLFIKVQSCSWRMNTLINCTDCQINTCVFKQTIDHEGLRVIEHKGYRLSLEKSRNAFHINGISTSLHVLCSGYATLDYASSSGKLGYILFAKPGSVLSAGGLMGFRHSASAVMLQKGQVLELKRPAFDLLVLQYPNLFEGIMSQVIARFQAFIEHAVKWSGMSVKERIAATLFEIYSHFGDHFYSSSLRTLIAQFACINREQCTRYLSELKTMGLIKISKSTIDILQPDKIQQIAYARHS